MGQCYSVGKIKMMNLVFISFMSINLLNWFSYYSNTCFDTNFLKIDIKMFILRRDAKKS